MDAHILQNGVKMETFVPQNDRTMERNVNFSFTATIPRLYSANKVPLGFLWPF